MTMPVMQPSPEPEPRPPEVEEEASNHAWRERPLSDFVAKNSAMYRALEFFILLDPEEQVTRLGDPEALRSSADRARALGDNLTARIDYESAAKIALYRQQGDLFAEMLSLAQRVTPGDQTFSEYHRTLLRSSDQAMRVASEVYAERDNLDPRAQREPSQHTAAPGTPT
jgi:hypothetical protein